MRKIKFLIYKEFRQFFRDRALLRAMIFMPIVMMFILGYAVTTDVKNISIIICDQDQSFTSRDLIEKISTSGYFRLLQSTAGYQRIGKHLDSGQAKVGLVIPNDFEQKLNSNQSVPIQILVNGEDANSSQIAMGYLSQIVRAFAENLFVNRIQQQPQIAQLIHFIEPETRVWYNPNLESVNFMVPGIVAMLMTVFSMFFTAIAIVREKEDGTLEQLQVTPIKSRELIIGKTVPYIIISFVDASFIMILAKLWFGIPIVGSIGLLFLYLLIYILSTLGFGIFISTLSQTQMQALFLSWFFMVLILILSGFFIPIENMPAWIQFLSKLDPLRYLIAVIREIFLKGSGLQHIWRDGVIMLTFGLVIMALSALRFKKRVK